MSRAEELLTLSYVLELEPGRLAQCSSFLNGLRARGGAAARPAVTERFIEVVDLAEKRRSAAAASSWLSVPPGASGTWRRFAANPRKPRAAPFRPRKRPP